MESTTDQPLELKPDIDSIKDKDTKENVSDKVVVVAPKDLRDDEKEVEGEAKHQQCIVCSMENCGKAGTCGCPQLEAEPVHNNQQLLDFQVRSRHIHWPQYVEPLNMKIRGPAVYLDKQMDFVSNYRRPLDDGNRRELFVCHDMMGNYLNDRHYHSSEKYDDYRFLHWSAVDYFCYFSHKYISIPPSGWLNAAHRHGVPVLGTYIVEGDHGSRLLHEVLQSIEMINNVVQAMTRLCQHFGFEGWLINVECKVRSNSMPNLYRFVEELRQSTESQVPHGRVLWYDSVINNGDLSWQNELNQHNVNFFRLSHGTLINYHWNDRSLETSAATVRQEGASPHRVFMGLDVFGRDQVARFRSSQTFARIADKGFSGGIFAPAWCFETLQQYGYNIHQSQGDAAVNAAFLDRNERWWSRLWPWLGTHPYCSLPFYTDFGVGSGSGSYLFGNRKSNRSYFNLGQQSLQPSVPLAGNAEHSFDTAFQGGNSLRIINYDRAFRLFLTNFELPQGILLLSYAYKMDQLDSYNTFDVVMRFASPSVQDQDLYVFCGSYPNGNIIARHLCYISPLDHGLDAKYTINELPFELGSLNDDWQLRHYIAKFDGPVQLQDIGVKCRRRSEISTKDSYLGAIYVNSLSFEDWQAATALQPIHQKVEINVYSRKLWNEQLVK